MKAITYCLCREEEQYIAQCLNVDISSFGPTREEALAALREAVELYFEDAPAEDFSLVEQSLARYGEVVAAAVDIARRSGRSTFGGNRARDCSIPFVAPSSAK